MTQRPTFSNTFTAGTILQLVTMLLIGAAAFFAVKYQSDAANTAASTNAEAVRELRSTVEDGLEELRDDLDRKIDRQEIRVRSLETNAARADERYSNVLQLLTRIDNRLAVIERNERNAR